MPVHYEVADKIARITLEGRSDGNMFSPDYIYKPLTETLKRLSEDDDAWVAVVSAPEDRKAFSYGGDIDSIASLQRGDTSRGRGYGIRGPRYNTYRAEYAGVITGPGMMDVPKPLVFAVSGYCLGAATLLLMTLADIVVASEDAKFGLTENKLGGPLPGLGAGIMPRQLPWRVALELLLTGRVFSAEEALGWGFINRVVPTRADAMTEATEIADLIAKNPPLHIQAIKELAISMREIPYQQAVFQSRIYGQLLRTTPDAGEGFQAFVEKRPPQYKGVWK